MAKKIQIHPQSYILDGHRQERGEVETCYLDPDDVYCCLELKDQNLWALGVRGLHFIAISREEFVKFSDLLL